MEIVRKLTIADFVARSDLSMDRYLRTRKVQGYLSSQNLTRVLRIYAIKMGLFAG